MMRTIRIDDVSITSLRALVTIAEAGSFTRASERLGMTQSGVSQAIRALESSLHGGVLLTRGRDGATLTSLGEKVLAHARHVLAHVECIRQESSASVGIQRGKLRIGSVASAAARLLPGLIRTFQRRYPRIEIVLVEGTDQEVRDWVLTGIVEVGFAALPQKGLRCKTVARDEVYLVVSKTHRLARRATVQLAEIKDDPFLMSKSGCEPMIQGLFRSAKVVPRVVVEIREIATLLALVREEVGISLIPALAIPPETRGIATISLEPRTTRRMAVLIARDAPQSPAAHAFLKATAASAWSGTVRSPLS